MSPLVEALTVAAAVASATAAGTFFTFSTFTIAGLRRLDPSSGAAAMQAINEEAPTPAFMTLLFGTGLLSLGLTAHGVIASSEPGALLRLVAGVIYVGGVVVTTGTYHVPRNNALAGLDPESDEGVAYWNVYLREWVRMNHVRTVAPVVAAVLYVLSL